MLPILISGVALLLLIAFVLVRRASERKRWDELLERERAKWHTLADPRGFVVDVRDGWVQMRGRVAGRDFELDWKNGRGHGSRFALGMRVRVEDEQALLWIGGVGASGGGDLQPPLGDPAFDAVRHVRTNATGLRYLGRLGARARRVLVDFPELHIEQSRGLGLIYLPRDFDGARLDAACELVASLWGVQLESRGA